MSIFDHLLLQSPTQKKASHILQEEPAPKPAAAPHHGGEAPPTSPLITAGQAAAKAVPVPALVSLFGPMFGAGPAGVGPAEDPAKLTPATPLSPPPTPDQQKQIDQALKVSTKQLETGLFNPVRDSEARTALKSLTNLPPELQGKAIEQLDAGTFDRLLHEVPANDREQFKSLMNATSDPDRKLRLFAEYHKSKVRNESRQDREATKDEGSILSQDESQKKNEQTNKQRDFIVKHTESEIDAELDFLLKKSKDGKLPPEAVQKYIDSKEREHDTERKSNINQYSTLEGLSDEDRVAFVKKQAETNLDSGLFNPVTDQEATDTFKNLQSLPKGLQGKAVEEMDKDAFKRLLGNLPDDNRENLKELYESTHDPERKLLLWAEYHKAQAQNDASRRQEKGDDAETKRRNGLRDKAADGTKGEVNDEVDHLLKDIKDGKATEKDVLALDERKQLEHKIEMDYNLNLTNDKGSGGFLGLGKRERRVWSLDELKKLNESFGRLPKDMIANNHALEEIHRKKEKSGKPSVGGEHDLKVTINMYDSGSGTTSSPNSVGWRFDGETSRIGGHPAGAEVTPFEAVLVHELGHAVHNENGPAGKLLDTYMKNVGWNSYGKGELKDAMRAGLLAEGKKPEEVDAIVDANIKKLEGDREKDYYNRLPVSIDGKAYEVDPYSGKFLSYNEGQIPQGDRWGYARSNPLDNFAEHYSMAVHNPEQLRDDLVTKPKQEFETRQAEYQAKKTALEQLEKNAGANKNQVEAMRADVASVEKELAKTKTSIEAMDKQWRLMRNDVFHTDEQVQKDSAAVDKSIAAVPADKQADAQKLRAQFEKDAETAATPEQVMRLRQQLETNLANL